MITHRPFPPLVARGNPSINDICDPSGAAWEILRRRADYHAANAEIAVDRVKGNLFEVELLTGARPDPIWGLQFRRTP